MVRIVLPRKMRTPLGSVVVRRRPVHIRPAPAAAQIFPRRGRGGCPGHLHHHCLPWPPAPPIRPLRLNCVHSTNSCPLPPSLRPPCPLGGTNLPHEKALISGNYPKSLLSLSPAPFSPAVHPSQISPRQLPYTVHATPILPTKRPLPPPIL